MQFLKSRFQVNIMTNLNMFSEVQEKTVVSKLIKGKRSCDIFIVKEKSPYAKKKSGQVGTALLYIRCSVDHYYLNLWKILLTYEELCIKFSRSLLSVDNNPSLLQIYFLGDNELQVERRCTVVPKSNKKIVSSLQKLLHEHNVLIKIFKNSLEKMPSKEHKIIHAADKIPAG
ncbi:Uncharacterized protein FWK35_00023004 [Aphis craccivora]|uniref:Uncharacterized protein n=1 Tax=Aphis craccivora TaxID=307492 RepID=A0A6G0Y0B9_APHCR|nr:Uncharacterized protein FWK35_00023004 [Aphis craccivora]